MDASSNYNLSRHRIIPVDDYFFLMKGILQNLLSGAGGHQSTNKNLDSSLAIKPGTRKKGLKFRKPKK